MMQGVWCMYARNIAQHLSLRARASTHSHTHTHSHNNPSLISLSRSLITAKFRKEPITQGLEALCARYTAQHETPSAIGAHQNAARAVVRVKAHDCRRWNKAYVETADM